MREPTNQGSERILKNLFRKTEEFRDRICDPGPNEDQN